MARFCHAFAQCSCGHFVAIIMLNFFIGLDDRLAKLAQRILAVKFFAPALSLTLDQGKA